MDTSFHGMPSKASETAGGVERTARPAKEGWIDADNGSGAAEFCNVVAFSPRLVAAGGCRG